MYCFKCGTEVHDGDRFCRACGTSLAAAGTPRKSRAVPALLAVIALLGALLVYGLCTWQPRDETEPTVSDAMDDVVQEAISCLQTYWQRDYASNTAYSTDGYLEIKNTRVITIAPNDLEDWSNIACVVEFELYSDLFGGAPYYVNAGTNDTVTFYTDGRRQVSRSPFLLYAARTYSYDFDWIEEIQDLGTAYNGAWYLK